MRTGRAGPMPAGRDGFALPTALGALVLVAIMVVGGFASVRQEFRVGLGSSLSNRAFYAAEEGVTRVLAQWTTQAYNALDPFESITRTGNLDGASYAVEVRRLTPRSYFLDATGTVTEGGLLAGASRRLGVMVKIRTAEIQPPAALTTQGDVSVRGTAEVHGGETNPGTWGAVCPAPDPANDAPGIMTDATGVITTQGAAEVTGNPAVENNPDIGPSTFEVFGDMTWDDLVSLATKRYPGGNMNNTLPYYTADGECDTAHMQNWGDPIDPSGPCGNYFPIVYVDGTARFQSGGVGQGILLVNGDLDLRGGFIWTGIVIVQGELATQGNGNRIFGGVWAKNADLETEVLTGGSVVQFSTCASTRAILNNDALTRARPLLERGWVDLSSSVDP
jgi:hypothetical protein